MAVNDFWSNNNSSYYQTWISYTTKTTGTTSDIWLYPKFDWYDKGYDDRQRQWRIEMGLEFPSDM